MRHENPNSPAQTRPSGPAHPSERVGSTPPGRLAAFNPAPGGATGVLSAPLQARLSAAEALSGFTPLQRLQLSEAARLSLDEEIELLRSTLRRFMRAVNAGDEAGYPTNLARALDLLGLTCSRLASVTRVNLELNGADSNAWTRDFNTQMQSLLKEWEEGQEGENG